MTDALLNVLPLVALGAAVYAAVQALLWRASGRPRGFEARMPDLVRTALRR